jgi:hypothetical protein
VTPSLERKSHGLLEESKSLEWINKALLAGDTNSGLDVNIQLTLYVKRSSTCFMVFPQYPNPKIAIEGDFTA